VDHTWFADTGDFGKPILWPGHAIRLRRDFWEHSCLDVDVEHRTVTHRDQLDHQVDDPNEWPSATRPLRRGDQIWQVLVEKSDHEQWIAEHEGSLAATREFAAAHPHLARAGDVEAKSRALDLIRSLGFGWIPLAEDVSLAIDNALR